MDCGSHAEAIRPIRIASRISCPTRKKISAGYYYEFFRNSFGIVAVDLLTLIRIYSYMSKKKAFVKPTEKEFEILQVLWKKGPAAVKDVQEALGGDEKNGYTTILKLMQIMHEKGLLTRQKSGKLHLYEPVPTQEHTRQFMLDKMIHTVFQGSAMQLVMSALGNKKSSKEELLEIKRYLEKLEGGES